MRYALHGDFLGTDSCDMITARKFKQINEAETDYLYEKRHKQAFRRELLDHRLGLIFTINEDQNYADDPYGDVYETRIIDGKKYLVLLTSFIRLSLAAEDSLYFDEA